MTQRRSFLIGLGSLLVAPAIVRAESLMAIKEYPLSVPAWCPDGWLPLDGRQIQKKFYPDLYDMYKKLWGDALTSLPNEGQGSPIPDDRRVVRVISAKNLLRSNGVPMLAGAVYPIVLPGAV